MACLVPRNGSEHCFFNNHRNKTQILQLHLLTSRDAGYVGVAVGNQPPEIVEQIDRMADEYIQVRVVKALVSYMLM